MAFKVFLDANILLDRILDRPGKQTATDIISAGIAGKLELSTSPAVIHVTSYFTSQYLNKEQTKKTILLLLKDVRIIDCDHATAVTAVSSSIEDIEDALQYHTALKHNLDYFISSDKKLKKQSFPQLPVYSPAEFLAQIP